MTSPLPNIKAVFLGLETFGRFGGIQRFNQRLVRALVESVGADNLAAHFTQDKPADIPPDLSDTVTAFGHRKVAYISQSLKKSLSADTLILGHINLLWLGALARLMRPKLKVIMMAHGVEVWNDPAFRKGRFYEPYLLKRLDRIAVVSAYTARIMQREYGLPEALFTIFPNTVDPQVDAEHHPATPPFALAVSRMAVHDKTKHLDQVIRAMGQLPEALSHTRLIIVGDGVLRPELETLAVQEGVSDRVEFAGRVSHEKLLELYQTATLFALPSSKEGFGIVYLEAWSHRLPVICSVYGAAPEVVTDGVDGFAVDPMDIKLLAARMQQLFENPDLSAQMANAGAAKMMDKYTTEHLKQNVSDLLER